MRINALQQILQNNIFLKLNIFDIAHRKTSLLSDNSIFSADIDSFMADRIQCTHMHKYL